MQIELGKTVRDVVTGFNGVATGRAEYLNGEPQIQVEAPVLGEDSSIIGVAAVWFSASRLQVIEK